MFSMVNSDATNAVCVLNSWTSNCMIIKFVINESITSILPRFNVHLFLTRGTYSIKISYGINDIH